MTKIDIINEYETSKGKTVITHNTNYLEVGQIVEINSVQYKIKEIIFSSVPNEKNIISLVVE